MFSRASTDSIEVDGKDYLELEDRPSESYLELETGPSDSHFEEKENVLYDDTLSPQNRFSVSNGPANQAQAAFLQPPSCSSSYPAGNFLPLNGTGRKGQALPDPPPEASMCHLNNFNTNYNTITRREHCQKNATSYESASRELSAAGHGSSAAASSRCCIRCRDVFWLVFGLAMTAACIAGCHYSTRIVVAQLCQSRSFSLGDDSTILYGEVEYAHFNGSAKKDVFDPLFKNYVEKAMQNTVFSIFLTNVTVLGLPMGASTTGRICKFTITFQLHVTKRRGLEDFVVHLLKKFSSDDSKLRCIIIPTTEAHSYSCPDRITSSPNDVTSSGVVSPV